MSNFRTFQDLIFQSPKIRTFQDAWEPCQGTHKCRDWLNCGTYGAASQCAVYDVEVLDRTPAFTNEWLLRWWGWRCGGEAGEWCWAAGAKLVQSVKDRFHLTYLHASTHTHTHINTHIHTPRRSGSGCSSHQQSYSTSSPVSSGIGDHLGASIPLQHITSQPTKSTQPCFWDHHVFLGHIAVCSAKLWCMSHTHTHTHTHTVQSVCHVCWAHRLHCAKMAEMI